LDWLVFSNIPLFSLAHSRSFAMSPMRVFVLLLSLACAARVRINSDGDHLGTDGDYKCVDPWKRCTHFWCNANCNHKPRFCPPSYCRGAAAPMPPPAPKPNPLEKCPDDTILGTSFFNEAGVNVHKAYKLVCCPAGCEDCAGKGCAKRPGGAKDCCGKTITAAGSKCGSAPCVLGDPPAPEELEAEDSDP